jgi:hypothetical protein
MGFGPEAVTLHYVSPQDYGLSNPAFAPGEATAICT